MNDACHAAVWNGPVFKTCYLKVSCNQRNTYHAYTHVPMYVTTQGTQPHPCPSKPHTTKPGTMSTATHVCRQGTVSMAADAGVPRAHGHRHCRRHGSTGGCTHASAKERRVCSCTPWVVVAQRRNGGSANTNVFMYWYAQDETAVPSHLLGTTACLMQPPAAPTKRPPPHSATIGNAICTQPLLGPRVGSCLVRTGLVSLDGASCW